MKYFRERFVAVALALSLMLAPSLAYAQAFTLPDGSGMQGHIKAVPQLGAAPPTAVGCTIAANATDMMGTCTATTTSGSITFTRSYVTAPTCVVWDQTATPTYVYSVSATAITLTTIVNAHVLGYFCLGTIASS